MTPEAWIALSVAVVSIGGHLLMIGSWKATIEAEMKIHSSRIDRLHERDGRIFDKLNDIEKGVHKIELWIARKEGEESRSDG